MFQVLVDVYVDPELLVAYGMISSFFFVSWYLLLSGWPIILASFDAHVNLEVCFLFFPLFFWLHPKGSVQEPFHYAPLHLIEDLNICIWGFKFEVAS